MASQSETDRWRQQELALTAVEHRLQALGEYLAVYRASYASSGEGRHYARVRMLRKDRDEHASGCGYELTACERCNDPLLRKDLPQHLQDLEISRVEADGGAHYAYYTGVPPASGARLEIVRPLDTMFRYFLCIGIALQVMCIP